MSTERFHSGRQADTPAPEEQDPLSISLGEAICKCCDELGIMGCSCCPVRGECQRLWEEGVVHINKITLTDYRHLDRKFTLLKEERDRILAGFVSKSRIFNETNTKGLRSRKETL